MENNIINLCVPCEDIKPVYLTNIVLCEPCEKEIKEEVIKKPEIKYTKFYCYTSYMINMATNKRCNPKIECKKEDIV
jgi:hypothetical protein